MPRHCPVAVLADDDAHISFIVARKLDAAGFQVHIASDGEEALNLTREISPDILITDLQMPHMSGLELCRTLFADPATAHIPVIMLTARGYVLDADQIERTNIRHLMGKPFSARDVLSQVFSILNMRAHGDIAGEAA